MNATLDRRAARFLEQTLLWNVLIHAVAMLTMALVLLRALPGGANEGSAGHIFLITRLFADHNSTGGSGPFAMTLLSACPATYSSTRKYDPSGSWPKSVAEAMLGCWMCAPAMASR